MNSSTNTVKWGHVGHTEQLSKQRGKSCLYVTVSQEKTRQAGNYQPMD
jgi:hypothetical protein